MFMRYMNELKKPAKLDYPEDIGLYVEGDEMLQQVSGGAISASCEKPLSITQRMELRKKKLQEELVEIDNVLTKLKANPQIQEVIDAVSKMHY